MNINLQISDSTYQALVSKGARIKGSIGLVSPTEGNFNEHRHSATTEGSKVIRLAHGRASVNDSKVRLTLCVNLKEENVMPAQAIVDESLQAGEFIDRVIDEETAL